VPAARRTEPGFDPMLLAVISHRLDMVVREMTNTLLRTGRSALLNTARDFSCSITTAQCELLTAAQGLPIHCAGSDLLAGAMHRFHDDTISEGDAFLHNDPYNGNSHHADYSVLVPVFHDGAHVFTAIAKAHQADCGNSQPTTYAGYARDVYEEGALNFPCVRIQRDYTDNDDLIRMCRARIRVPDQWYGDYLATLGAARIGERRLHAVLDKYGIDVLRVFTREWFDYSERRITTALQQMPGGSVTGHGSHDPVPGMEDGIPVTVTVSIDNTQGRVSVDLTGNIDCVPTGFNLSEACARSAAIAGVLNVLPKPLPLNAGTFRRIDVKLRDNCLVGVPPPTASCSVATTNVADRVISVTQTALAGLGPQVGLGEGGMGMGPGMGVISGVDARRGDAPYINQLFLSVYGGPGSAHQDGWTAFGVPVDGGLMYRDSIEIAEQKYPILVDELRLLEDSDGAGMHRGACGSRVVLGPTDRPMTIAYLTDGYHHPSRGVQGGHDTIRHDAHVLTAAGETIEVPKVGQIDLAPGDRIVEVGGGGGGFGPPEQRDTMRVLHDVRAGLVSRARARLVYRVVISDGADGSLIVNTAETAALRSDAPASPRGG
jgi:N-methylhydantoinase B